MTVDELEPGKPYVCRYRVGDTQGLAFIGVRDQQQRLIQIRDVETGESHTVCYDAVWDCDTVTLVSD